MHTLDSSPNSFPRGFAPHTPARTVIIDPNRTKAELLLHYCNTRWGLEVVAVENSGLAGLAAATRTKPELALVSAHLPDLAPRDFIRGLKLEAPGAKAILLIQYCNEYLIHNISAANFHGVVWEVEEGIAVLGQVIERVRNGMRAWSDGIAQFQARLLASGDSFSNVLTNRHLEVLICITHSLSNVEIALQLGCSRGTAHTHRRTIMQKLDIHKTPQLIRYGLEKGLGAAPLPLKRVRKPRLKRHSKQQTIGCGHSESTDPLAGCV